jgi:hypothetical protein
MKTFPESTIAPLRSTCLVAALILTSMPAGKAATVIATNSGGDGFFHNESGSAYDFFDGTSTTIGVSYYFDGFSSSVNQNTGYLQFPLAGLAPGEDYSSITLNLNVLASYYLDDSTSAGYVRHRTNSSTANGLASQRLEGDVQVVEIKDQPLGWLTIDVTSQVENDLAAGYAYSVFSLNYNTAGYFRNSGFTVSTADAGSNGPFLSFTPVPEPSASGYLLLAAAGWAGCRRRK